MISLQTGELTSLNVTYRLPVVCGLASVLIQYGLETTQKPAK